MIQTAQDLLKTTLSYSAAFQSLVGAVDETEAAARIYHDALPPPADGSASYSAAQLSVLRPCAMIYTESFMRELVAMGSDCWASWGQMKCIIYRNVPTAIADDPSQVDTTFRVIAGDIISEMIAQCDTAGRLASRKFEARGPYRTPPDEINAIGDEQVYELIIDWGQTG
jgi:hypothetical protein